MVITANYDNDTTETVDFSDVVLSPATVTADDNAGGVGYTVTASYTENGITVSDSFNVQLELKEYATKKQLIFDANGGFFADTNSSFNELSCYAKDSNTDCIMSGQYKPATDQYRTFINWYSTPNCQDGTEVVQVYVKNPSDPNGPIKQLRAYKRVDVKAGQTVNATITINDKSLEWFDEGTNTIHTKEGSYELVYGNSSDATKAIGIKVE